MKSFQKLKKTKKIAQKYKKQGACEILQFFFFYILQLSLISLHFSVFFLNRSRSAILQAPESTFLAPTGEEVSLVLVEALHPDLLVNGRVEMYVLKTTQSSASLCRYVCYKTTKSSASLDMY